MATDIIFLAVISFYSGSNKIHPSTRPIRHIPVPVGPSPDCMDAGVRATQDAKAESS